MSQWHKTGCVLCAQNCGLEILVESGRMVRVKPDKSNLRSRGYACRKGLNVIYHQYPKDRITHPLKRVDDRFEPISWDQAIDEITGKMKDIVGTHGPRSLAYMGASAQGGHFEGAFGLSILRAMGSQYFYNSGGQEFSGIWWLFGRMLGKQYNVAIPDDHAAEMLVGWGWNGMESHQMPRAPKVLTEFSKDPERLLVIIDPRKSETAAIANIHLPVRPGTDALLLKAMLAIIIENQWEGSRYISDHVDGWDTVRPWFEHFDAKAAIAVCELPYDQVHELCRLMTTKRWCMHPDLGIYMGRKSTLNSYLMNILGAVCGVFCVPGGNVIPGMVMPMGYHADERDPKTWRTVATGMPPAAAGSFPPAVMPEEILNDHPDRLRAVYVSACNPLRSYPDTRAYEAAFKKLDLLVVNDMVMSESARLAHYVLPCRTYYESWDGTFFPWTFPEVFFQMRRPIVEPPGECLEASQIFTRMADKLGLIPDIPDTIYEAADLKLPPEFPLILNAGRHTKYNINTLMRNPEWNKGKRACTVSVNPADAEAMGLTAGQQVTVTTGAGSQTGELQVSDQIRKGTVLIPHGFGLLYDGEIYGINVNYLTKNTHRDPLGTPIHRFVPCRVAAA